MAAITLAVLMLGAGASVGINALTQGVHSHRNGSSPGVQAGKAGPAFSDITLGVDPFPNGTSVTLDQLAAGNPTLQLPSSSLASASNVGGVWENSPDVGGAAIYYSGSGIEVLYGPRGSAGSGGFQAPGYVQTIDGIQALALPAGINSKFAEVMLPLPDGHMLTLLSLGQLSDLTAVAAQMVPSASAG